MVRFRLVRQVRCRKARLDVVRNGKAGGVRRGMGWYVVVWWGNAGKAARGGVSSGAVR